MQYEDVPVDDFLQSLEPKKKDYLIACLDSRLKKKNWDKNWSFCKRKHEKYYFNLYKHSFLRHKYWIECKYFNTFNSQQDVQVFDDITL